MNAHKEIITTINNLKCNNKTLSKDGIIKVLKATKSITNHKDKIDAIIHFFITSEKVKIYKNKPLTRREIQVLMLIGNGESSLCIANTLNLSVHTIETHRKNICKKLQLKGNGKLLQFAILYNLKTCSLKT